MRKYAYTTDPWASQFPELLVYDATPASGSDWYCADTRSCPMASWNNTVICNSAIGSNRALANRAVWPSDPESSQSGDASERVNVPARSAALTEKGNKAGSAFAENTEDIDLIESTGMASVLLLAKRIAQAAEASWPACDEGARTGAARSDLVGRNNNPCTSVWALNGMASCDPCAGEGVSCAPRDLPDDQCGGNTPTTPTTPSPTHATTKLPTPATTSSPTPGSTSATCEDSPLIMLVNKRPRNCAWAGNGNTVKRCGKNGVKSHCAVTCNDSTFCNKDSTKRIKLEENGKFKSCKWVGKTNTVFRCDKIGIMETW